MPGTRKQKHSSTNMLSEFWVLFKNSKHGSKSGTEGKQFLFQKELQCFKILKFKKNSYKLIHHTFIPLCTFLLYLLLELQQFPHTNIFYTINSFYFVWQGKYKLVFLTWIWHAMNPFVPSDKYYLILQNWN